LQGSQGETLPNFRENLLVASDPVAEGSKYGLLEDPGSISIHNINSYMGGRVFVKNLSKSCGLVE